MAGIVQGLISSIKTASAPAGDLVLNGSFTVNVNGWYNEYDVSRSTAVYNSSPASMFVSYLFGEDAPFTSYSRTGVLTIGQAYSLSLWLKNANSFGSLTVVLQCGTASKQTVLSHTASGPWVNIKVENVVCAGNTNMTISIASDAEVFYVDDVVAVAGTTAP
jgi:hypothetical protein